MSWLQEQIPRHKSARNQKRRAVAPDSTGKTASPCTQNAVMVTFRIVPDIRKGSEGVLSPKRERPDPRPAGVAQLVEHLICNQRVRGSNPFASSSIGSGRQDTRRQSGAAAADRFFQRHSIREFSKCGVCVRGYIRARFSVLHFSVVSNQGFESKNPSERSSVSVQVCEECRISR